MKTQDSSRRVAKKPLVLSRETIKSLGVRTGVQTGVVVGIGPGGGGVVRTISCIGVCASMTCSLA